MENGKNKFAQSKAIDRKLGKAISKIIGPSSNPSGPTNPD